MAVEAFDDPAFPQRAVRVEGTLQCQRDGPEQLGFVAGPGKRHPSHVLGEVESRIVDPLGRQHLGTSRYRLNPFCENRFELVVAGGGTVDDGNCADRQARVPLRIAGLEKTRIQCRQLCHDKSPPSFCDPRYKCPPDRTGSRRPKRLRTCFAGEDVLNNCAVSNNCSIYCGMWGGATGRRAGRKWNGCLTASRAMPGCRRSTRMGTSHGPASAGRTSRRAGNGSDRPSRMPSCMRIRRTASSTGPARPRSWSRRPPGWACVPWR
ncbi:Uncharacterised protein [Mycobacterium tuberculosis]|uniref:Uncharacterized protein n=1 Tax=Mycobacterium tuberculosis TaxID=1773 RepID=A0A916LC63_MYCTX|nr:Uncharacterised protein [Mycobacterium tuberculosis]